MASQESTTSPTASMDQTFVTTRSVRSRHLNHAEMRGVCVLFRRFFPLKGPRLSKPEQEKRWQTYKRKILNQYGRLIKGKLNSEKALISRYSDPLKFLKYKLPGKGRALRVSDLRPEDRQYFLELSGGVEDVQQLMMNTVNIDSVSQMAGNYQSSRSGRKRRRISNERNVDENHNRRVADPPENTNSMLLDIGADAPTGQPPPSNPSLPGLDLDPGDVSNLPPQLNLKKEPKRNSDLTPALQALSAGMDIWEREALDKTNLAVYEQTIQKMLAVKTSIQRVLNEEPHMVGSVPDIPGLQQHELAFNCWLHQYRQLIVADEGVLVPNEAWSKERNLLVAHLAELRMQPGEWAAFLSRWVWLRIFHENQFDPVWAEIKDMLGITKPDQDQNDEQDEADEASVLQVM